MCLLRWVAAATAGMRAVQARHCGGLHAAFSQLPFSCCTAFEQLPQQQLLCIYNASGAVAFALVGPIARTSMQLLCSHRSAS